MEGASRKREREEHEGNAADHFKNGKMMKKKAEFVIEDTGVLKLSDSFPSFGVFEFPWDKEGKIVPDLDDWRSDDVFRSSLVDGWVELEGDDGLGQIPSAAVGFPDDEIEESWLSTKEEMDGADCIWRSVLSQPLSIENGRVSRFTLTSQVIR